MNLIPLVGVLALGWRLLDVMVLYWLENAVIGAFAVARMATAGRDRATALLLIPFFCVHYGMFWSVHGSFVMAFFGSDGGAFGASGSAPMPVGPDALGPLAWLGGGVGWALVGLTLSHGASYLQNWWGRRGERRYATPKEEMVRPYGRVVILQLTILVGGFAAMWLGAPVVAMAVLVALKTGVDLAAHLREHAQRPTGTGSGATAAPLA
ncbi:MAG: DUF6498-containing protein [Trueperaceae bacterium]